MYRLFVTQCLATFFYIFMDQIENICITWIFASCHILFHVMGKYFYQDKYLPCISRPILVGISFVNFTFFFQFQMYLDRHTTPSFSKSCDTFSVHFFIYFCSLQNYQIACSCKTWSPLSNELALLSRVYARRIISTTESNMHALLVWGRYRVKHGDWGYVIVTDQSYSFMLQWFLLT